MYPSRFIVRNRLVLLFRFIISLFNRTEETKLVDQELNYRMSRICNVCFVARNLSVSCEIIVLMLEWPHLISPYAFFIVVCVNLPTEYV